MELFMEFMEQQWLLFVALAVIGGMLVYSYVGDRFLPYKSVGPTDGTRLINQDAMVLDVRSEAEFNSGHIAGAKNLTLVDLKAQFEKLGPKDRAILVVCESGSRSAAAASFLCKNAFTQVNNLAGGLTAWRDAKLPLVTPSDEKRRRRSK